MATVVSHRRCVNAATRRIPISLLSITITLVLLAAVHEGNCQHPIKSYDDEEYDFSNALSENQEENEIFQQSNDLNDENSNDNREYRKKDHHYWFDRKIVIPSGTLLTLTAQVSRPDIVPGFFYDVDGIIIDAVVEMPIWMKVEEFLNATYEGTVNEIDTEKSLLGFERCFLYEKLEELSASFMEMSPSISHTCLLRAICETQSISAYYPLPPTNIIFELIHLLLTPSLGFEDECYQPYLAAETIGQESGHCSKYASYCPLNIGAIILNNFFPPDEYH